MALTIAEEKKQLRSNIRKTLAAIPQEELTRSDDALFARFLALPQVQQAKTIFAFWGIPGKEPETARMMALIMGMFISSGQTSSPLRYLTSGVFRLTAVGTFSAEE